MRIVSLQDSLADVQKEMPQHAEQGAVHCEGRQAEHT